MTGMEVVRELMEEALEAALQTEQPSTLTQLAQVGSCKYAGSCDAGLTDAGTCGELDSLPALAIIGQRTSRSPCYIGG